MSRKRIVNLAGQRFGRLLVLEEDMTNDEKKAKWICKCDCGNIVSVYGHNLKYGTTKSCGCLYADRKGEKHPRYKQNAIARHRLSATWYSMKQRCFSPNATEYSAYGGRGITVCSEWKNDFWKFVDYVSKLEHYGEEGRTLDRIDNNGNYEPGNVRWATKEQQYQNRGY